MSGLSSLMVEYPADAHGRVLHAIDLRHPIGVKPCRDDPIFALLFVSVWSPRFVYGRSESSRLSRAFFQTKEGTTMQRNTSIHAVMATLCLLMLSVLLLLSACGNYSSPGSGPNSTPQPTKGGYSLITVLDQELQLFLAPQSR